MSRSRMHFRFKQRFEPQNYRFATYDKSYIKILKAAAENENLTAKDITRIVFSDKHSRCQNYGIDTIERLILSGMLIRKEATWLKYHPNIYILTVKGRHLLENAEKTKEVCDFIVFAKKFKNMNEWMLETVLNMKGEHTTKAFFLQHVAPWLLDFSTVGKHIQSKLKSISFFKSYMLMMTKDT